MRLLVLRAAAGLRRLGVAEGDRVGLVGDVGPWWLVGDLGILAAGAGDVPRGTDTTPAELGVLLGHSGAEVCLSIGEEATSRVLASPGVDRLRAVVRLDGRKGAVPSGVTSGEELLCDDPADPAALPCPGPEGLATVIYTSGTTGRPKGVTLEQRNILHQLRALPGPFGLRETDLFLVMLPPWHCFERVIEYLSVSAGAEIAYSNPRALKEHIPQVRPTWMGAVPRIWEMVLAVSGYGRLAGRDPERARKALHAALGGGLRCAVAGGGSTPEPVDRAYNEAGIRFLVGYGLTETSPVLTLRLPEANRAGTIGRAVAETEIRIVDRTTGAPLPTGGVGVVHARGPQVMRGYWKEPGLTASVLGADGWFDTGDLGSLTPEGDLEFRGRAKETVVLRGGEKVEPQPIEERLRESPFIEQAVLVGTDQKVLGALILPRKDAVEGEIHRRRGENGAEAVAAADVEALIKAECARLLTEEAGFMVHERVARLALLEEPFTSENGLLTATLKLRRPAVHEKYADRIRALFGE